MKERLWTQRQPKASNSLVPHLQVLEPWPETWTNLIQVFGLQSTLWCRTGSLARSEPSGFSLQVIFLQVNSRLMTEMHYHEKPAEISVWGRTDVMSKRNYYTCNCTRLWWKKWLEVCLCSICNAYWVFSLLVLCPLKYTA